MHIKVIIALAYIVPVLILNFFLMYGEKKLSREKDLVKICFLCSCMVAPLLCTVLLFCKTPFWASFFYALYFSSMDWILLLLINFVSVHCSYDIRKYLPARAFFIIAGVDTAFILSTPFTGFTFRVEPIEKYSTIFFLYRANMPFKLHLLFAYLLCVIAAVPLIAKIINTSKMYRPRYTTILYAFIVTILFNAVYLIYDTVCDISVIGYPIMALFIYYFSEVYAPRMLLSSALKLFVGAVDDGVIIFDPDGNTMFYNSVYEEYFLEKMGRDSIAEFKKFCDDNFIDMKEDFEYDWHFEKDGKVQYTKIFYKHLHEGRFNTGSFINFQLHTRIMESYLAERHNATHDELTGLYNASYFYERVKLELETHPSEKYVMVCSDIANFKMINDVFGEETANRLLCDIADGLRMYTKKGEVYCRLGNDIFALLMPKKNYREAVFMSKLSEIVKIKNVTSDYPVLCYIGVYEIEDRTLPASYMTGRAIYAVRSIKGQPNKRIAYYDDTLKHRIAREKELLNDISSAMKNGDLKVFLQPEIAVDGELKGCEALLRWEHPKYGLLTPSQFLNLFEKNGHIARVDRWVWEEVARILKKWKSMGYGERYISINTSSKDFYYMDAYKELTEITKEYDVNPASIIIEVAEDTFSDQMKYQPEIFSHLSAAGFKIGIDNFGSGDLSVNLLYDMRVDVVKLDRGFLYRSAVNERGKKILEHVFSVAKDLNVKIIVDGVETEEQLEMLKKYNPDFIQGHVYDRSLSVQDFEEKYLVK